MDVKVSPAPLKGKMEALSAKSLAHRYLVAAALADAEIQIYNNNCSTEIKTTADCLSALSAAVTRADKVYKVCPFAVEAKKETTFNALDSLTTLKMLLPVCAALSEKTVAEGEGSLLKKKVPEVSYLKGVRNTGEKLPVTLIGKLRGGDYYIGEDMSSQFLFGLMLALSILNEKSRLFIPKELSGKLSVNASLRVLKDFGCSPEKIENGYILGESKLISPKTVRVEGEESLAAYFMAASLLGEGVEIENLPEKRGKIMNVLSAAKAGGGKFSAKEVINLPLVATTACFANGKTEIEISEKEVENAKETAENLKKMGADINLLDNKLLINGAGGLAGGVMVDCFGNAKLAMSIIIAAAFSEKETTVLSVESARKAYPEFFNQCAKLGGMLKTY